MSDKVNVVLFGASKACENYLKYIKNNKEYSNYNILAIADNDRQKVNTYSHGHKVILPEEIAGYKPDKIIITSTFLSDIYEQLTSKLNFTKEIIEQAPKNSIIEYKIKGVFEEEDTRVKAEEILRFIVKLFNDYKINYFIDHGTLLGIIREQRIMPWDDDIDITILKKHYVKAIELINMNLEKIEKILACKIEIEKNKIKNNTEDIRVKVYKEENYTYDITIKTVNFINGEAFQNITKSPEIHFLQNSIINLWDLEIKAPYKPEEYLTIHYGDWKTPKKNTSFLDLKNYIESNSEKV